MANNLSPAFDGRASLFTDLRSDWTAPIEGSGTRGHNSCNFSTQSSLPRAGGIKESSITGKAMAAMKYLPPPEEMRTPLPEADYFIIACVTLKKLATKIDGGHSVAERKRGGQGGTTVQRVDKWSCYL